MDQRIASHETVVPGLDLTAREPIFITASARIELQTQGFTVIKNALDKKLLAEVVRFIHLKQQSEGVDSQAYRHLSKHRHAVGLVTKNGWTKFDYVGPVQEIITGLPNLYTCMSELYGTSRLCPNFYEYKYNYGRSKKW